MIGESESSQKRSDQPTLFGDVPISSEAPEIDGKAGRTTQEMVCCKVYGAGSKASVQIGVNLLASDS